MRGRTKIVIAALIVAAGYSTFKDDITKLWDNLHVKLAEYPQPKKTVWLNQNVSKEDLSWFYHADQGTRTFGMPYEWFLALEKPVIPWLVFTDAGPFNDPAYLDRYGFIPDTIIPGKKEMPIGFAKGGPMLDPSGAPWRNPSSKQDMNGIGLTCAACHTGRFTYKDTAVVIDGGPALTDLFKLKQGMGVALLYTRLLPEPLQPVRRENPGTGFDGRGSRDAEIPDRPAPQSIQDGQEPRGSCRLPEHPGRLRAARRAEPDRQPGVLDRSEEAGKLCGLLGAGALPADLEHAMVRLGAV